MSHTKEALQEEVESELPEKEETPSLTDEERDAVLEIVHHLDQSLLDLQEAKSEVPGRLQGILVAIESLEEDVNLLKAEMVCLHEDMDTDVGDWLE